MGDNTKSGIKLSQFFDVGEHDREIHFDWGYYLGTVTEDIWELAVGRCYRMLVEREEWVNMLDRDYKPSSSTSSE